MFASGHVMEIMEFLLYILIVPLYAQWLFPVRLLWRRGSEISGNMDYV